MVPERLPAELLEALAAFEPGVIQLEVGVQTLNSDVAKHIGRPMNVERIEENLTLLRKRTGVHLHVDLIVGLPGEDLLSFGRGLDRLVALGPQEIQVGILKRLKGTPLQRHTQAFALHYSKTAPFEILDTSVIDREEMARMKRFAHFWDRFVNSGQFAGSVELIWQDEASVFEAFHAFSVWLYRALGQVSHNSLLRLAEKFYEYLTEHRGDRAAASRHPHCARSPARPRTPAPPLSKSSALRPRRGAALSGRNRREQRGFAASRGIKPRCCPEREDLSLGEAPGRRNSGAERS